MARVPKKGPKSGQRIASRSVPKFENYDHRSPVFSLRFLNDNYCISRCQKKDKLSFVNKIRILSKFTWKQIKSKERHSTGYEKISRDSFNVGIPSHITKERDLISFRFSGKMPMIGYREDDVFHIIWFDKNYKVYKHGN